jgi:hypothetical protein
MADRQEIVGALIAATETSYGAFTDRTTGEVKPPGQTYHVWLAVDFHSDPQQVKVKDAMDFVALKEAGPGAQLRLDCELRAFNSRISRTMLSVEIQRKPAPAKAS